MTVVGSLCWVVLAPVSRAALERIVVREWQREFPYAIDPQPWQIVDAHGAYSAVLSSLEGTEGPDWQFAEIVSKLENSRPTYSLRFDPEQPHIVEWIDGQRVSARGDDPFEMASSLGVDLVAASNALPTERDVSGPSASRSAALVENASLAEVRQALGEMVHEAWLHLIPTDVGVLITSDDGRLGSQAWDVAEALPDATVYHVQKQIAPPLFTVSVLKGSDEMGWLSVPPMDDEAKLLPDIKGARTPDSILRALGIPAEAFGDV